jgi:peptidyl-prolyl cis-trans isomerase B (cyclophilin B)
MGEIVVRLFDKTPKHRDNFVKLVKDHFYDSLLFHRIIAGFMIQGGDPESKNAQPDIMLGKGDVGYTIPAEFDSTLYHKKGALAAARTNNPEKASSGCQFYIVQGKKFSDEELDMISMSTGVYFSPARRMTYKMLGGTPKLDMNYTVFGEVESGIDVVDQIAQVQKNNFDRPVKDVHMKMELLK